MPHAPASVARISAAALKGRLDRGEPLALLDVREDDERAFCALPAPPGGADLHVPLGALGARLDAVLRAATGRPLVVYCHHGLRSMVAARALAARGAVEVYNLEGGIDAWSADVDPGVPRY